MCIIYMHYSDVSFTIQIDGIIFHNEDKFRLGFYDL